jgi:predicted metal-dependent HD superfamily phosphohydrolase
MAIFIDPPRWPAHGTEFSHLISNASLAELHEFAAAAGVPERAFDEDHYDVPARRYADLVRRGAVEVTGGDLARILAASGLRIPARRRAKRLRTVLAGRWDALLPGTGRIAADLLERWSEPHRAYHTPQHLLAVLEALDALLTPGDAALRRPVLLAAWFHDAVYRGRAGEDEEASAALAAVLLEDLVAPGEAAEVQRLVLLTRGHAPAPGDRAGALLCDADLSVLGGGAGEYAAYLEAVRREYAHVPAAAFTAGRADVVRHLLALDPLFSTEGGAALWSVRARENLGAELARLESAAG